MGWDGELLLFQVVWLQNLGIQKILTELLFCHVLKGIVLPTLNLF